MAEPRKTEFSPGFVARVAQGVRYAVRGVTPETWMSPGQPIAPVAQQVQGRAWDFPAGENLQIEPRAREVVSFERLRNLARYCDLVAMAVRKRQDQLCAMQWEIRPDEGSGIKEDDRRISELRRFFTKPDGRTRWSSWLRMVLEDVLVIDAPAIYVRPRLDGKPFGLEVMDGSTFRPIIDEDGRQPLPPNPAYQQVLKGVPAVDFTADELLYMPLNPSSHRLYGRSPVEEIVVTVEIMLRRQAHKLQYYTEGATPDNIYAAPPDWTLDQIKRFRNWFNALLSGNTAERRRALFVPHGTTMTNMKEAALKDDYDEWLARVVCYAFSLPPTPFIKQHSRANDVTQRETAEDEGKLPLMNWVRDVMNTVIHETMGIEGISFEWKDQHELDPTMRAQADEIDVKNGVKSIDEVRAARGMAPIGVGNGIITATGLVPIEGAGSTLPDSGPEPTPAEKLEKRMMKPLKRERDQVKTATAKLTKLLSGAFAAGMPKVADAVVSAYEGAEKLAKDQNSGTAEVTAASIVSDIDLTGIDDPALVKAVTELLEGMAKDGASEGLTQIGITDEDIFSFANDRAISYAKDRGAELVGKKWVGDELIDNPDAHWAITDTTREQIKSYVTKALQEGWSGAELRTHLQESFAFSRQRAEMIARTEIAKADVEGNLAGWKESGVVTGKAWLLSSIHPKTDICDANADAGTVPFNSPFPSGDNGPPAHPMCFVSGTPIAAAGVSRHMKRWFEGELIRVFVEGKEAFAVTPNHPILTGRGWISAGELKETDHLFRVADPHRALRVINPADDYVQAPIEEIADALLMAGGVATVGVPETAEHLDIDEAIDKEVRIVRANSRLMADREAAQLGSETQFQITDADLVRFARGCTGATVLETSARAANSGMGSGSTALALTGTGSAGLDGASIGMVADAKAQRSPSVAKGEVMASDRTSDVNARLAGLIAPVQITKLVRVKQWCGHVFNLKTRSGWYVANSILAHNCECDVVPVIDEE